MRKSLLLFIFLSLNLLLLAQDNKKTLPLVQFTGIITDIDSSTVIPYVTVNDISKSKTATISDYQGFFTLIVHPGDTVLFTAIGYNKFRIVVPRNLPDNKYTAMVQLKANVVNLPTVHVFPWATTEEFTQAFLAMKLADDDYLIAKKNLSKASINGMIVTLPRDGAEIGSQTQRYNFDRLINKNMVQTNPLLNPFAWGRFMQQIFDGDKRRSEKD